MTNLEKWRLRKVGIDLYGDKQLISVVLLVLWNYHNGNCQWGIDLTGNLYEINIQKDHEYKYQAVPYILQDMDNNLDDILASGMRAFDEIRRRINNILKHDAPALLECSQACQVGLIDS